MRAWGSEGLGREDPLGAQSPMRDSLDGGGGSVELQGADRDSSSTSKADECLDALLLHLHFS